MFDGSISVPASAAARSRDRSFCASLKVPLKVTERERRLPEALLRELKDAGCSRLGDGRPSFHLLPH